MPKFGARSNACLVTCAQPLVLLAQRAILSYDFSVIEGHRPEDVQNGYFVSGASKVRWPDSRHNTDPSEAFDIVPYPIDWKALHRFHELADIIKRCAGDLEIEIDWGYDLWKWDMPHWQLRRS